MPRVALATFLVVSPAPGQQTTGDGTPLAAPSPSISLAAVTSADQAADVQGVVVSATPVPTPWDNWKEKRDHIMPEVSGTQITVTKKATVIKLDKQPPIEQQRSSNGIRQSARISRYRTTHSRASSISVTAVWAIRRNPNSPWFFGMGFRSMSDWIGFQRSITCRYHRRSVKFNLFAAAAACCTGLNQRRRSIL